MLVLKRVYFCCIQEGGKGLPPRGRTGREAGAGRHSPARGMRGKKGAVLFPIAAGFSYLCRFIQVRHGAYYLYIGF